MATTQVQHQSTTWADEEATGWVGWVVFAAVMMGILGVFHGIAGLTALFNDEYYLVSQNGLVVEADYTTWGWVHLGLGILIVLAALSLAAGHMFGRVAGVVIASVSAVANVAFLAAYPVWSVIMIALDVIVIYAIVVHGRELEA
jgi:hypothetical protein